MVTVSVLSISKSIISLRIMRNLHEEKDKGRERDGRDQEKSTLMRRLIHKGKHGGPCQQGEQLVMSLVLQEHETISSNV